MFKTLLKDGRDVVLGILQDFFATHPDAAKWKWDADPLLSKIWISDRSPDKVRYLPAIVSRAGGGRSMKTGLRHFAEMVNQEDGRQFKRFSGKWHIPFSFIIASLSSLERDELADLVINCLTVYSYEKMLKNSVEMEPDTMTVSGDETVFIDPTTPIEKITVTATFFLEWYHDEEVLEPLIKKVVLQKAIESATKPLSR